METSSSSPAQRIKPNHRALNYKRSRSMLLELAKPVALLLCLLSLFAVFHTIFFTLEDPQLLLQPHQAIRDRVIDSILLLVLSAGISVVGAYIFREADAYPHP